MKKRLLSIFVLLLFVTAIFSQAGTYETVSASEADDRTTLSQGMTGDDVLEMQQRLYDLGYLSFPPDGDYGAMTAQAVTEFQEANGLYADGVAGNQTREKLAFADAVAKTFHAGGDWQDAYLRELQDHETYIMEVENRSYGYTGGISFHDITGDGIPEMTYLYHSHSAQGTYAYKIVSFQENALQTSQYTSEYGGYSTYLGMVNDLGVEGGMVNDLGVEGSRCIFTVCGSNHIFALRGIGEYEGNGRQYDKVTEYEYADGVLYPVRELKYGYFGSEYFTDGGFGDIVENADILLGAYHQFDCRTTLGEAYSGETIDYVCTMAYPSMGASQPTFSGMSYSDAIAWLSGNEAQEDAAVSNQNAAVTESDPEPVPAQSLVQDKGADAGSYLARAFDTANAGLLLRQSPSMDSGGSVVIPDGEAFTVSGESSGFGYATYQGASGWVRLRYVQLIEDHGAQAPSGGYTTPATYLIYGTDNAGLELRTAPSEESATYGLMMEGTQVVIEAMENGWGYTSDYAGHSGWANMAYLTTDLTQNIFYNVPESALPYQVRVCGTGAATLLVRTSPSADSGGVTTVADDEILTITQESNGFGYTSYKGYSGWVRLQYTQLLRERTVQEPTDGFITPAWYTVSDTENAGLALRIAPTDDCCTYGYIMEGSMILIEAINGYGWGYTSDYAGHHGWVKMESLTPASSQGGSATAAVEEIVQEPQDVNISVPDGQTSALDTEAYVTDAYTLHLDEFNGCDYHIPQINLTGNDAAAINQEIYDKYYNDIQEALYRANSTGFYGDPGMFDLYYDWYVNGDILSLVVQSWWMDSGHDVDVYNMSLSSQARLDNRSIYEAAGLTDEEFETLLISLVEQSVKSLYSNMDSDTFAYMKSDLAESTSSSNISSSLPYIYADGELSVFVKRKFSLGQNTWSWCEFTNLGNVRILNVTQNDSKEASLEVSENYETTTATDRVERDVQTYPADVPVIDTDLVIPEAPYQIGTQE